jgi:hypothetical protein
VDARCLQWPGVLEASAKVGFRVKIADAGHEGRRPEKILAGGANHRLPPQPASRPGGSAEDIHLSNARTSSAPPGRVSFWRLTGGCHHRLISSDPPGQQKGGERPERPTFAEVSICCPGACGIISRAQEVTEDFRAVLVARVFGDLLCSRFAGPPGQRVVRATQFRNIPRR